MKESGSLGSIAEAAAQQSGPASMEDLDGWVWLDGNLTPWREAKVHILSQTLQHGFGVFEGLRAYRTANGEGAIFRLEDHTARLFRSAKILGIEIPYTPEQINAAHLEAVRANSLLECYIRPTVFLGGDRPGVSAKANKVHVAIAAWVWKDYMGADASKQGIELKTSSFARPHAATAMCKAKATGNYILSIMAHSEAKQSGFDDGLMLDSDGKVAEASTSNLFAVSRGRVSTPASSSVLEGITRDTVIEICARLGLPMRVCDMTREDVYTADELFLTGTAAEITPVRAVDRRLIGNGVPGQITRAIREAYKQAVSIPDDRNWLTVI